MYQLIFNIKKKNKYNDSDINILLSFSRVKSDVGINNNEEKKLYKHIYITIICLLSILEFIQSAECIQTSV